MTPSSNGPRHSLAYGESATRNIPMNFTILVFGTGDVVTMVLTMENCVITDAILNASTVAHGTEGCRGFQIWSSGKVLYAQVSRQGVDWTKNAPAVY